MTDVRTRSFELTSTVTFHDVSLQELETFAGKLFSAVSAVLPDYPSVEAFLVEPDLKTGDINYGLRFISVDPAFVDEMADEILEKAVELVAQRDGAKPIGVEREESVLVLTQ